MIQSSTYIDFGVKNNDKSLKFIVGDHVRILKCKNIFAKGYTPNWSEEDFVVEKVENTVRWVYAIKELNDGKTVGTLYEKELQKANQTEFRIEKVMKKKR